MPESHAGSAGTSYSSSPSTYREIEIAAERAAAAAGGIACSIGWHETRGASSGFVHAPADRHWRAPLAAAHGLAERQLEHLPSLVEMTRLQPGRLAGVIDERLTNGIPIDGVALRVKRGGTRLTITLVAPRGRPNTELEAIARIAADFVLALLERDAALNSRDFWIGTASANGARLAHLGVELAAASAQRNSLQNAIAYCAKLLPHKRFAGLGGVFAGCGTFEAWFVAIPSDVGMVIAASSVITESANAHLDAAGPIAECVASQRVVRRTLTAALWSDEPGSACAEDRFFRAFAAYVCIPCGRAAVGLAARCQVDANAIREIELLANWLAPTVEKWLLESEIDRLQRLVHTLGLRMFRTVDLERRRIARDLHDQQVQLVSAARIALETDLAIGREILRQLDDSFRKYLRRLRTPALPSRFGLSRALRDELGRLTAAGIKGELVHPERITKLPRVIQELCYQVTREALSNVIRHSKASRVEISAELRKGMVVLRIDDDGKGPPDAAAQRDRSSAAGLGLAGLAERLDSIGGRLKLQRLSGITRLSAEIPGF